jgi:hypothetical protein
MRAVSLAVLAAASLVSASARKSTAQILAAAKWNATAARTLLTNAKLRAAPSRMPPTMRVWNYYSMQNQALTGA